MSQKWTDERLDDLNKKVDDGFAEMRTEFRAVRAEMDAKLGAVEGGLRGEIAALHRLMVQLFASLGVTMILGFAAILLQHHI